MSARADGEDPGIDDRLVDAHLRSCSGCRAFAASISGTAAALAPLVQPAPDMADLSRSVSKLHAVADRASAWGVVRVLLVVVAVEVIVLSLPALVLGEGDGHVHEARHLGAFSIAYGAALLVVAVRPARARAVLPVAAVLTGALLITAIVDLASGSVPLTNETTHLPELVSVVLIWLLAARPPRRSDRRALRPAPLRLVDADQRSQGDDRAVG